jgi:anaerobic selenocysteine-containing dehydrogenase
MHPDDAARLGLTDGDRAAIASAHGRIVTEVRLDPGVRPGTVSVNHGRAGAPVAALTSTSDGVDPLTGMPWASGLPVRVDPA